MNDRELGMNVVVNTLVEIQKYCESEGKNNCNNCPFRLSYKKHKDGECLFHREEPHNWQINLLDELLLADNAESEVEE